MKGKQHSRKAGNGGACMQHTLHTAHCSKASRDWHRVSREESRSTLYVSWRVLHTAAQLADNMLEHVVSVHRVGMQVCTTTKNGVFVPVAHYTAVRKQKVACKSKQEECTVCKHMCSSTEV